MITKEQALTANHFRYLQATYKSRDRKGEPLQVRRSGRTQTWKTRPNDFRVPIKYGMYESGEITQDNAALYITEEEYQRRKPEADAVSGVLENPASFDDLRAEGKRIKQLVERKGWRFIQASPPQPGGGGIAPFAIVLSDTQQPPQPFVTHYVNLHDGGFYWGHYYASLSSAVRDFEERVRTTTPGPHLGGMRQNPVFKARGRHGNLVAKKATDEYSDSRGKHVKLYSTEIVSLNPDGTVTLRSGGHMTVTTKRRMNQVSEEWGLGFSVSQRKYEWYVSLPNGREVSYYDGITLNLKDGTFSGEMKKNPVKRDKNQTTVIFRKTSDGEITAVFPLVESSPGNLMCYAHLGQHGSCSPEWVREETTSASPSEYAALKQELESIGYDLQISTTWQRLAIHPRKNPVIRGKQFGGKQHIAEEPRKKYIALQEKRGEQWFTLALFPSTSAGKDYAVRVGKQHHRRYPSKQLRVYT